MKAKEETYTLNLVKLADKSFIKRFCIVALSYCIVTFGQPAYSSICSVLASSVGFALLFSQLIDLPLKPRLQLAFGFFFAVQAVGLFWFTYHPFSAVIGAYLLLCFLMAVQFAVLSLFITREMIRSRFGALLIAGLWTLIEWTRLGWCSGFYFDLTGIAMTANLATLQAASLFGVLGLSFWVIMTNVFVLRAFIAPLKRHIVIALLCIALPYIYGLFHLLLHEEKRAAYDTEHPPLQTLIVHSKKVPEEFKKLRSVVQTPQSRAIACWQELIAAIAPYRGKMLDLILMPEGIVPYGSTSLLFTREEIETLFRKELGIPLPFPTDAELCSEDVAQAVATAFASPLIIGLEGIQYPPGSRQARFFNSAFFFTRNPLTPPQRYDKQILVPMGEYIPLDFAKQIAARYGVYDSFTPGRSAKVFQTGDMVIGPSVCYEETFGGLMRQNSLLGANMLVNLTDDYWFPYSKLAIQHYTHARPRTVENGTPLLRSCNFGISGAIDSLGRPIILAEGTDHTSGFLATVSSYHYKTLYSRYGDVPILIISLGICLIALCGYLIRVKKNSIF